MNLAFVIILTAVIPSWVYATEWNGFDGLYVGMPAAKAKEKGFTACREPEWKGATDEECDYNGRSTKFFLNEPIKKMGVGIKNGKVQSIYLETKTASSSLKTKMIKKIGKPTLITKYDNETVVWEKNIEYISLNSANGVNMVLFNTKPEQEKSKKLKPQFTEAIRKKGRNLYSILLGMKKERDFIENGFGYSKNKDRYKKWEQDVVALDTECSTELQKLNIQERVQSELFEVCVATTNLSVLGMHYAMNGCVDDRSTQMWKSAIKSAFIIK